ncbi:MAG: cytochrome c maturation protein CcmE [Actinobacteria bacterium]|nr:cytochrome c maturation protein CcmE [Actinomycetota bacterium]
MRSRISTRPGVRLLIVAGVALVAVGTVASVGLGDNLVYYRTPAELSVSPAAPAERVRLGGLVVDGSVRRGDDGVTFVLTDGTAEVTVVHGGDPEGVFAEGQGAVVEGVMAEDGVFRSDLLMVKHSNEYRAPADDGARP